MASSKPTLQSAAWGMTGFLDAAKDILQHDRAANELRLYFYAVSEAGWRELRGAVSAWRRSRNRAVTAYVGTDHAITDGPAIEFMQRDGVNVRLLRRYNGVYHPKVVWFVSPNGGQLLVGSNNLTLDGLKSNIEFATLTQLGQPDAALTRWHQAVHAASDEATPDLVASYANERQAFGEARARARVAGTFTWSRRSSGGAPAAVGRRAPAAAAAAARRRRLPHISTPCAGDLLMEIMPLETGTGGSQIQVPMAAADRFFRLGPDTDDHLSLVLNNVANGDERQLTMTRFANRTARLVIKELEYRDRPCILLIRPAGRRRYDFEIVRRAVDPDRYRDLIGRCGPPTREGSRRWAILG